MRAATVAGGLQTVTAALDLLDCFAEDEELGVTEVSRRLGVAKSTAHRLLVTLASRGIVEQNARTGRYRLGLHLYELGNLAITRVELRRNARPLLEELREACGWTVQLSVASGVDSLVLERLQTLRSSRAMGDFERFDRRLPLHVTAHGKALCAFDPVLAERRIEAGLPARTENTITSAATFARELADIRRRGFATAVQEALPNVASVGAPVLDPRGQAIAAISINGSPEEVLPALERLGKLIGVAAARLAKDVRVGMSA